MASDRPTTNSRNVIEYLLFAGSLFAVVLVYLVLLPPQILDGEPTIAIVYLVAGWVPYTLVFYSIGRLFSSPGALPRMRIADLGLGLFLVSLLVSLGIDALGFTPAQVPEGHLLQAVGVFVGLAMFGWGIGRRSRSIGE